MEGFFLTLATLGGKLDGFDGWNILEDEGFDRALKICDEADHGHFNPAMQDVLSGETFR